MVPVGSNTLRLLLLGQWLHCLHCLHMTSCCLVWLLWRMLLLPQCALCLLQPVHCPLQLQLEVLSPDGQRVQALLLLPQVLFLHVDVALLN